MGTLKWTEEASACIHRIHAYIAKDNPNAARRTIRDLYQRLQVLETFPRSGHEYTTKKGRKVCVFELDDYRVVHQPLSGDIVVILGIYHSAMDLDSILDALL